MNKSANEHEQYRWLRIVNINKETITTTKVDLTQVQTDIINGLEAKGFYVEVADNGDISFSLTSIGLDCLYAVITKDEQTYYGSNL